MPLSADFERALVFATRLHAYQRRKGTTTPYIAHLLAVASIVLENGGNEHEAIAALLHDAIEDQGCTPEELRQHFGETVAAIVVGCTDTLITVDTSDRKASWRARKEAYIAHIRGASPSIRLVSAADKLHNARSLLYDYRRVGEALWQRFNAGKAGVLWYYRSLVESFKAAEVTPLVEELDRVVTELCALVNAE
jgi:(p)ppGpp synthase/HD superfamily hydrolase